MNNNDLKNKLKQLKIEDNIWIIYIIIIFLSWYSNSLERKYFIFNDLESKEKYRTIIILIFSILLIIYVYFFIDSLNGLNDSKNKTDNTLAHLSSIASLLIVISGVIFLYIALNDKDLSVELAFN